MPSLMPRSASWATVPRSRIVWVLTVAPGLKSGSFRFGSIVCGLPGFASISRPAPGSAFGALVNLSTNC